VAELEPFLRDRSELDAALREIEGLDLEPAEPRMR